MKKRFLLCLLALCLISVTAYADSFVIKKIQIQGLQGISTSTVYSYLPVKVGSKVDDRVSIKIIQKLYKTGFFDDVILDRSGNTLIIKVKQRPIISRINISGNKSIDTDKLKQALKTLSFVEGHVFNPSLLEQIKSSLKRQYFALGKYNAQVDIKTTKESRHRVAVNVDISEGVVATIHQIQIIGHHAFSERTLVKQFKLSTPGLFSFYTHDDQYSREKLEADLETLRSYYMDRGYLKFKVDSTQVSITPDHKQVYITIRITEGAQYKISGYAISGRLILPREKIEKFIQLKKGQVFSRKTVMDINKNISKALGNKGYANANVKITPKIDEKNKTVFVSFIVIPGRRVYVRHITFLDNYRTNDVVLRRSLLQFEGGALSTDRVNQSKRQLLLLPYVRDVQVSTTPVPGVPNQVDVNYKVTERPAAELQAGIAYSQIDKFMITASLTHRNVFGTGSSLSLSAANSSPETSVSATYYNPYYTKSGIGRSFNLYTTHFNAQKANVTDYVTNNYGGSIGYNFRVTRDDSFQLGFGYENVFLSVGDMPPTEANKFIGKHGRHFYHVNVNGGWTSQGFDRVIFPTRGLYQVLSGSSTVPISRTSLEFYKLGYTAFYYHPIYRRFIGQLRGAVNYGNGYGKYSGDLPFFKNFYVGGIGSVRGYAGNSLGPKDSNGNPLGGKFAVSATTGLVVPNPLGQNVRTILFIDGGNVYDKVKFSNIRYAAGLEFDWLSPIGMLNFSLADALNNRSGDDPEFFQFNIGASF